MSDMRTHDSDTNRESAALSRSGISQGTRSGCRKAAITAVVACLGLAGLAGCANNSSDPATAPAGHGTDKAKPRKEIVVAMLPKLTNIAYFRACEEGARRAAEELGITLIYDGPSDPSASDQNNFIETWTRQGVDAKI